MSYARDPGDDPEAPCYCGTQAPGPVLTTAEHCPACGDPNAPVADEPCTRCDEPITGTPVKLRDDPLDRIWCSEECRDADSEGAYEQGYQPGVAT
jgi:hypothetical protein